MALAGDDGVGLEVEQQKEKLHVFLFDLGWVGFWREGRRGKEGGGRSTPRVARVAQICLGWPK